MLLLMIVSLLVRGSIIQYKTSNDVGSHDYYPVISFGEGMIMFLAPIWLILSVALALDLRLSIRSTSFIVGIIGFITSIIYLLLDPFGFGRYYFD